MAHLSLVGNDAPSKEVPLLKDTISILYFVHISVNLITSSVVYAYKMQIGVNVLW